MTRTRTRMALTLTTLGLAGLLGLSACGAGPATTADLSDEAYALQAVGLQTGPVQAAPSPSAAAGDKADKGDKRRAPLRRYLRKNTLHGEVTLQGKDGAKTIVVQRGTVTAADTKTVSVKSSDGFTQTWTFGANPRVVQDKKKTDVAAVKAGATVGVAGTKDGDTTTARLVVVQ